MKRRYLWNYLKNMHMTDCSVCVNLTVFSYVFPSLVLKAVDSAQIKGLKGKDFDKFVHKAEETFSLVLHANASIAGGFDLDGERSKDVLSHFILRLALARSPDSLRWMLNNEVALFKLRLNNESAKDKEMFLNYSQINYEIVCILLFIFIPFIFRLAKKN